MDRKYCTGCYNNFYNGFNDIGVKKCWYLKDAKMIWRKKVAISQRPPWKQKAAKYPSCYKQTGYVFVGKDQEH